MTVKDRISIDPKEYYVRKGDRVHLSNYKFDWDVRHVSYDGALLYLRSVTGNRYAQVLSNQVTAIWRDPKGKQEVDNTQYYTENFWEDIDELEEDDE